MDALGTCSTSQDLQQWPIPGTLCRDARGRWWQTVGVSFWYQTGRGLATVYTQEVRLV